MKSKGNGWDGKAGWEQRGGEATAAGGPSSLVALTPIGTWKSPVTFLPKSIVQLSAPLSSSSLTKSSRSSRSRLRRSATDSPSTLPQLTPPPPPPTLTGSTSGAPLNPAGSLATAVGRRSNWRRSISRDSCWNGVKRGRVEWEDGWCEGGRGRLRRGQGGVVMDGIGVG